MSRIGKKVLNVSNGVSVTQANGAVTVKGPKGSITMTLPSTVTVDINGAVVHVKRVNDSKAARACHGTVRATLGNHITGVLTPFTKILDIQGVGYQVAMRGKTVALKAGYCNEVILDVPAGIQVDLPSNTRVIVTGVNRQQVGQFAAVIRATRPPEPYNGKGPFCAGPWGRTSSSTTPVLASRTQSAKRTRGGSCTATLTCGTSGSSCPPRGYLMGTCWRSSSRW